MTRACDIRGDGPNGDPGDADCALLCVHIKPIGRVFIVLSSRWVIHTNHTYASHTPDSYHLTDYYFH